MYDASNRKQNGLPMLTKLLSQIKQRRLQLGLKGIDMPARTGLTRQQYALIEKSGNPNLKTLDLIAEGLDATIILIPKELRQDVERLLNGMEPAMAALRGSSPPVEPAKQRLDSEDDYKIVDPWKLLDELKNSE